MSSITARRERKVVTVLFVDLVGFTARAEELDPEDVEAILRPYHERLRGELERFGGTVEKFIGDAVMALFGAPVAHEDDPERAVRAALAIRDWAREEEGAQVRIAVNTGEALINLGARPESGEGMAGRCGQYNGATPGGGAGERSPCRRGDVSSDSARDRLPRGEAGRGQRKGGAGDGVGSRRCTGARRTRICFHAREARRARAGARAPAGDARPRSRRPGTAARHARRGPRHR